MRSASMPLFGFDETRISVTSARAATRRGRRGATAPAASSIVQEPAADGGGRGRSGGCGTAPSSAFRNRGRDRGESLNIAGWFRAAAPLGKNKTDVLPRSKKLL